MRCEEGGGGGYTRDELCWHWCPAWIAQHDPQRVSHEDSNSVTRVYKPLPATTVS